MYWTWTPNFLLIWETRQESNCEAASKETWRQRRWEQTLRWRSRGSKANKKIIVHPTNDPVVPRRQIPYWKDCEVLSGTCCLLILLYWRSADMRPGRRIRKGTCGYEERFCHQAGSDLVVEDYGVWWFVWREKLRLLRCHLMHDAVMAVSVVGENGTL